MFASLSNSLYFFLVKKHIILRKNEEHRLLAGHQWIFSNEIKSIAGNPDPGDVVEVHRHDGKFLGTGFFNPHSLIALRFLSNDHEEVSFHFFEKRISKALSLRKRIYPNSECFRLVHGESDFLPGLIIDKYNEFLAIQTLSAGMDRRLTLICDVLESLFHPKAIVERNESPLRSLEHLEARKGVLRGTPDQTIISEYGAKFKIDVMTGQKTGFFLDQRENRRAIRRYVKDLSVLDCFCNEGGFAIHAFHGGAKVVRGIDSSELAVAKAKVNCTINDVQNVTFELADVFEKLKDMNGRNERFDVVILDPPSFVRNKKSIATALRGYKQINTLALGLLNSGGFLVTASCSHHVTEETFLATIEQAAHSADRKLQLLEFAGAGPDHPVIAAMPETKYLKFAIFSVS
ncbi:MAG TPA: class I SAM-dependent rRNA methyltransferase [Bacteroidota bacterium]|nr:class I SAM-dependent rRNA methyltransferase [Bacteroidota bacterium]